MLGIIIPIVNCNPGWDTHSIYWWVRNWVQLKDTLLLAQAIFFTTDPVKLTWDARILPSRHILQINSFPCRVEWYSWIIHNFLKHTGANKYAKVIQQQILSLQAVIGWHVVSNWIDFLLLTAKAWWTDRDGEQWNLTLMTHQFKTSSPTTPCFLGSCVRKLCKCTPSLRLLFKTDFSQFTHILRLNLFENLSVSDFI